MRYRLPILLLLLLTLTSHALAASFTDPANHYSLTYPPGWTPMTAADLAAASRSTSETFTTGARSPTSIPFCMVAIFPRTTGTRESLTDEFRREFTGPGYAGNDVSYDPARNAIVSHVRRNNEPDPLEWMVYAFLGKDRMVVLFCYAHEPDFPTARLNFDAIADSFHFDPGYAAPAPPAASSATTGLIVAGSCVVLALIALGALLLFALLLFLLLRRRKRAPKPAA